MICSISTILMWVLVPIVNFSFWFYIGHTSRVHCPMPVASWLRHAEDDATGCETTAKEPVVSHQSSFLDKAVETFHLSRGGKFEYDRQCHPKVPGDLHSTDVFVEIARTSEVDRFRRMQLAPMTNIRGGQLGYGDQTAILKKGDYPYMNCSRITYHVQDTRMCVAIVRVADPQPVQFNYRYDADVDDNNIRLSTYEEIFGKKKNKKPSEKKFEGNQHNKGLLRPTGFFRKVPKDRGHARVIEKMWPFVKYFDGASGIEGELDAKLQANGVKEGDDLVVMVINQGEIDLFLNFACSCKLHNISLSNVMVFAGSSEIVTVIESTGAMGNYHVGYSHVNKKPSNDYLDRVFVDMMWYKAFSIYLILRKGINVLFQDVDLVWFREPFSYFKNYAKEHEARHKMTGAPIEAFFSDDGQRSLRYAPFYANSGFYYLLATKRSVYFAWSVMTSMDAVQVLGSHQNVLTARLVEEFSITAQHIKLLDLVDFPGGIMYHHDYEYMKRLKNKAVQPYGFHMCWTQGKPDKLIYLRKARMWYLTDKCSNLEALTPEGEVFGNALEKEFHDKDVRWNHLSQTCCSAMPGAP